MAAIEALLESIQRGIQNQRVMSEAELAIAVSAEIEKLDLVHRESLRKELGEDLEEAVFTRVIGVVPTASGSLTRTEYRGDAFYTTGGTSASQDELEAASKRLAQMRSFGKPNAVEDVLGAFLCKSGYAVMSRPSKLDPQRRVDMKAIKAQHGLNVVIFGSIAFAGDCVSMMDREHEYVIAVPTEQTPEPFLRFCREKASLIEGKKVQVWVVDVEKKTVNPFLGYTHDDDIYRNFDDPKVASFACRWYGVGKELWVRSCL